MDKLPIYDRNGKQMAEIDLPESVFSYEGQAHLLYEVVLNTQARKRQGTASTKTRTEVRGGGKKPWRQKGTGRARAGSIRSPLWRKGGTVFGPRPRDYSYDLPKKSRRNGLKLALTGKLAEGRLIVLDDLTVKEPKTAETLEVLKPFNLDSALVVDKRDNRNLFLAIRNLAGIKAVDADGLNVLDVLKFEWLVMSRRALESVMERLK